MSSRRPWRLVLGLWGAYWIGLAAVTLGPLALAVWRATHGPDTGTNNVSVNFGNGEFTATVVEHGQITYTGSAHLLTMALWIAGPPLLAWLAIAVRARREERAVGRV